MSATIATPTATYKEYADREVQWLGYLPSHWEARRLGTIAEMRVSNVDKHSKEEELPVRLCNYVDVYKNDHISRDMPFMRATASTEEIDRFRLHKYDVLITKDSETWEDIGVPALVTEPADDLISGYHLALLRTKGDILGPYLSRTLQSRGVAHQFHIAANGVTRYGLTHNGIRSVVLPIPPLDEQAAIVRHLDDAEQRIRAYVSAKDRLIALLEEERQAVIHQAVTRGLDPNVRLKPSGVEWLDDVPEHWEVVQLGRIGSFSKGSGGTKDDEVPKGIPCIRYGDLYTTHKFFVDHTRSFIPKEKSDQYTPIKRGDVLFPGSGETIEEIGKSAVNLLDAPVYCGGDLIIFRPSLPMDPKFSGYVLDTPISQDQKSRMGRGVSIMHIYSNQLKYLWLALPPTEEQGAVAEHIDRVTSDIDATMERARRQIELMEEYRTRLIADVVTGKIDIQNAKA